MYQTTINTLSWLSLFVLSLSWKCVVMNCPRTFNAPNGTISSDRNNDKYCTYTIRLPVGKRIHIKWLSFNVFGYMPKCSTDDGNGYVRITRCTSPLTYLIRYCGDLIPNDVISYDNCVRVEFYIPSTLYTPFPGPGNFKLEYQTLNESTPLNHTSGKFGYQRRHNSANIYTPNWPLTYSGKVPYGGIVRRVPVGRKMGMKILFMGIDLYTPSRSRYLCWARNNDILELSLAIYDKNSKFDHASRKKSLRYCGNQKPFTRTYGYNIDESYKYVDFIFNPGNTTTHNHTGFALGIVFFDTANIPMAKQKEPDDDINVPAIIIPIILIILISLYCVYTKGRKQGGVRAWVHMKIEERKTVNPVTELPKPRDAPPAYTLPTLSLPLYPPPSYDIVNYDKQVPGPNEIPVPSAPPPFATLPQGTTDAPPAYNTSYPPPPHYNDPVTYQNGTVAFPPVYNVGAT